MTKKWPIERMRNEGSAPGIGWGRCGVLFLCLSAILGAQTPGQLRIVDFGRRTAASVASVSAGVNITTTAPHGYTTGAAVYIYPPLTLAQDESVPVVGGRYGNRGRGYFLITVADETHFTLASDMYTGAKTGAGSGVAAGDRVVPLTTYYLRQGPRGWLDGPISKGAWSVGAAYRAGDLTTYDGRWYLATADHSGQQPPNASYWTAVDPTRVGPGVFTASLRDPNGKASESNLALTQVKALLDTYWPQPAAAYDWDAARSYGGSFGSMSAFRWFATGGDAWRLSALRLAERTEDLANGSVACDLTLPYCGRGGAMDFARIGGWVWTGGLSAIYDTLSQAQKAGLADRLLNHNDVLHNGIEAPGQGCKPMAYVPGSGTIRGSNYIVTGTGFSALPGLQPGSVLFWRNSSDYEALGRVKSVDSDTQLTLERAYFSRAGTATAQTYASWWYSPPFGYQEEKTCGVAWWWTHHPSSPRMIPGQEPAWIKDFPPAFSADDSPQNNRTLTGLEPVIAIALLLGHDDLRAVRLGEQAINYYMTQTMAQAAKSRWTGLSGHGTMYGPGRIDTTAALIAWMLKNSLTETPPGILDGGYLSNILRGYQYSFWLGQPVYVQPWANGSAININGEMAPAGEQLHVIGPPMMIAANLYPDDPFAPYSWNYLRERRGDFGETRIIGGWGSIYFNQYAFPFYDPLAARSSPKDAPLQQALWTTDAQQCIEAGLYCRPDTGLAVAFSQTGWEDSDTQVMIQGQAALPVWNEDNYGTAGNITILQNNGPQNSQYLLGGNGVGESGYGSGQTPSSGLYDGNTISLYNATTGADQWAPAGGRNQYARMERWAGRTVAGPADNSYAYAMVNLTPAVRSSANDYNERSAAAMSFYLPSANATRVQRHFVHLKSGSGNSNYVIVYDDISAGTPNELRAYWHYEIADLERSPRRRPDWLTTFDRSGRRVVLTTPQNRLSSQFLPVGTSQIALAAENFAQSWCDHPTTFNPSGVCDGNYRRPANAIPGAIQPGTYRVHVCASSDGAQCSAARSAEWISIHKPSTSTRDTMPEILQPACAGTGAACAAVEILDPGHPKVAVFARQGAALTAVSFTTKHTGNGQYVITGLAPGMYRVAVDDGTAVRAVTVIEGDGTLSFISRSGSISVRSVGTVRPLPVPKAATAAKTGAPRDAAPAARRPVCNPAPVALPVATATDLAGNVYIADAAQHTVRVISQDGARTIAGNGLPGYSGDNGRAIDARLNGPSAVAVDAAGAVYIADTNNHRIRRVADGVITTVAGDGAPGFGGDGGPADAASLNLPGGVALDQTGALYISDSGNHRIRRVSEGVITTIAGTGAVVSAGDGGPAMEASLLLPAGIWIDGQGVLYIGDDRGSRLRKVAAGVISRVEAAGCKEQ